MFNKLKKVIFFFDFFSRKPSFIASVDPILGHTNNNLYNYNYT